MNNNKINDSAAHTARGGWIPAGGLELPDGKWLNQGRRLRGAQRIYGGLRLVGEGNQPEKHYPQQHHSFSNFVSYNLPIISHWESCTGSWAEPGGHVSPATHQAGPSSGNGLLPQEAQRPWAASGAGRVLGAVGKGRAHRSLVRVKTLSRHGGCVLLPPEPRRLWPRGNVSECGKGRGPQ